jgi:accessory colonization factor AcfC
MENNKRRLLKDLPFGELKKGRVLYKGGRGHGGNYSISRGNTYYSTGGSSDNGITVFDKSEESILDTIWDNEEWFEDAVLKHIDFIPSSTSITLKFDPIDIDEVEDLTKGIIHILDHLKEGGYVWNKFTDITTQIKNN